MQKKNLVQFQMSIDKVEIRAEQNVIVIEGYASTPDVDSYNSIIDTLAIAGGMERYMKNPVILLGHDMDKPIGKMVSHNIDLNGLRIVAEISQDIDGIMNSIKDGVVKGFSIGFHAMEWSYQTKQGILLSALSETELDKLNNDDVVRKISKIELLEISVVSLPANPNTLFTLTRALKQFFDGYEKRYAIRNIGSVVEGQEEIIGEEEINNENIVEEIETVEETIEETIEEVVKETEEEEIVEEVIEETQGDETETTGETPEPQMDCNDPISEVENTEQTSQEESQRILELERELAEKEIVINQAMETVDKMQKIVERKTDEANRLKTILDKTPAKKGFAGNNNQSISTNSFADELRDAKARA